MTAPSPPRWKLITLAALALAMIPCFAMMATLEHFTRQGPLFLRYFGAAFLLYLAAVLVVWRVQLTASRLLLVGAFAAALLMRLPLWFTEPTLSSDLWRYLWDGHLLTAGHNPYAERVDSPALDPLAPSFRERVQHQWMASPYPPAAQLTFAGIYALFPKSPTAMQMAFSLFDLATGAVLLALLQRLGRPTGRALLYLWSPLIVTEFAHSAHVDSLMTLLVLLALWWLIIGRYTASAIALGLATLTKFIPALLLPVFLRRWGWRRALVYAGLIVLAYLPFVGAGLGLGSAEGNTGILGAARIYAASWKTNDGLFFWLVEGLKQIGAPDPISAGKVLSMLALLGLGLWVLMRSGGEDDEIAEPVLASTVILVSGYTLLSAAVFPWYLTWLIALLPLLPVGQLKAWWAFLIGWIYFSGAVYLSYLFYVNPSSPREIGWVRRVEYWPLFAVLLLSLGLLLQERRNPRTHSQAAPRPPDRPPGNPPSAP